MKAGDVLKVLHISRQTLTKYVHEGYIKAEQLPNGRFNYDMDSVYTFLNKGEPRKTYIYARVSSQKQEEQLGEQLSQLRQFCSSNGYAVAGIYTDIASGIGFGKRKEFFALMDDVMDGKVERVVVTYRDRLSRDSFDLIERVFGKYHCEIVVMSEVSSDRLDSAEIADEMVDLMQYYSKKITGGRKARLVREALAAGEPVKK